MEKLNKITSPAGDKLRQLQKIVNDIKKNDTGIFQKIKRFQNDQVALICKTGKDTWDRITSKTAPPSVPKRDYLSGPSVVEDDWVNDFDSDRDSDYDRPDEHSDTEHYVVPLDDGDDSYEPPPNDNRVSPSFKTVVGNNGYADKQKPEPMNLHMRQPPEPLPKPPVTSNRLQAAKKPLPKPMPAPRPQPAASPSPMFRKTASLPQPDCDDEENYIVPDAENYIEPTKEPLKKPPAVNRHNKPVPPPPQKSPTVSTSETEDSELYVVPENEPPPSPPRSGSQPKMPSPSVVEQEDEYEVCEDTISSAPEPPIKPRPLPLPRNLKPTTTTTTTTNLAQKPKIGPVLPQREIKSNTDKPQVMQRQRIQSAETEHQPVLPVPHKLPPLPKPNLIQRAPEIPVRHILSPSQQSSTMEKDADVLNKEWYVSSCDRRKAEDALTTNAKDGSFLVRKSSGQDSKQPFTLVVYYNRRVYNIPVRYIEATRQYALGREKSGEEKFSSVSEMINSHRQTPLVLIDSQNNTKDSTKLKQAVKIP
ncbi:B-cell linker protein isoform X3 [Engystomops pustulosus]|uniref:B-cell linker protein isoform X3 n=1 Tax=Engystomops pustulosus TaxID=76066 RepID=UPI003AFB5A4B